jgi:hypothetical protein
MGSKCGDTSCENNNINFRLLLNKLIMNPLEYFYLHFCINVNDKGQILHIKRTFN